MPNQNQPVGSEDYLDAFTAVRKLISETALGVLSEFANYALDVAERHLGIAAVPPAPAQAWRYRPAVGAIQVWCHKAPYAGHWYYVTGLTDEYNEMPPCPLSEDEHDRPGEAVRNAHSANLRGGMKDIDDAVADWEADTAAEERLAAARRLEEQRRRDAGEPPAPVGYENGQPFWLSKCVLCATGLMVTDATNEWACQQCADVVGWDGCTPTATLELKVIGAYR